MNQPHLVWQDAQAAESDYWGSCTNTYAEETVQLIEAQHMGLDVDRSGPTITTSGVIVDIGGGPVSLLLKAVGWSKAVVVDPGTFPTWILERYLTAGVEFAHQRGEEFLSYPWVSPDEIWIYNTLQHVEDPAAIVAGACELAPLVRLFEWVEFPTNAAHIHTLRDSEIAAWASSVGGVEIAGNLTLVDWGGEQNLGYHATFRKPAQSPATDQRLRDLASDTAAAQGISVGDAAAGVAADLIPGERGTPYMGGSTGVEMHPLGYEDYDDD